MLNVAFVIGSPRSGTTLLGDILDLHPEIARWYEPYFVLDHFFRDAPHDDRKEEDATDEVKKYILSAFEYYQRKIGSRIVVDKSPRNSLKILFLKRIFPQSKFIHILRDGRDTTLSILREWKKRKEILEDKKGPWKAVETVKEFIDRQPLILHKLAAIQFETGNVMNLIMGRHFLHRSRWRRRVGWGPRFEGWESVIDNVSVLEFSAMQWVKCVEAVIHDSRGLDSSQFLEIRYEDLLRDPKMILDAIFDFLNVSFPKDFLSSLPQLKSSNFGKWQTAFSKEEKSSIGPILNPMLAKLGYADNDV